MRKVFLHYGIIFLLAAGIFLISQDIPIFKAPLHKYSETKLAMGTVVRFDVCSENSQEEAVYNAFKTAWKSIENTSRMMSVFDERSDISKINTSKTKPVSVDKKVYLLLAKAIYFSTISDGAFDVTVWPLVQLWKNSKEKNVLPRKRDIEKILKLTGASQIKLLKNYNVQLSHPTVKLDLSGIAKGYAVDEAAAVFRQSGFSDFLIDAGGDIYAGGTNCEGRAWRVGIRDPRDNTRMIDTVLVSNKAITTSGDYEQFFEIQEKRYAHIINPKTGFPSDEVVSATVIAHTAQDADALSTALCVLGPQQGVELINALGPDVASLILTPASEREGYLRTFSKEYKNFQVKE